MVYRFTWCLPWKPSCLFSNAIYTWYVWLDALQGGRHKCYVILMMYTQQDIYGWMYEALWHRVSAWVLQYAVAAQSEKIPQPSHNGLLPMGYFVQVVMWVTSDKTYLKCKIGNPLITKVSFITNDPRHNLYKISHWKQCIVGRPQYLLCCTLASEYLCILSQR